MDKNLQAVPAADLPGADHAEFQVAEPSSAQLLPPHRGPGQLGCSSGSDRVDLR